MAKRKVSKTSKRRLTLLVPIVILAVGYLLFTAVTTTYQIYKLKNEQKNLNKELVSLKANSENLKNEITKLQDKDYVARYARENYLYTKDGEYVIKLDKNKKKAKPKKKQIDDEYIIYGSIILCALIFLMILGHIKRKIRKKRRKHQKESEIKF